MSPLLSKLSAIVIGLTIGVSLAAETACAQAKLWKDPVNGSWSDGTKWDPPGAPAVGDAVSITVAGTYAVTLDGNASVLSLTLGASTGSQTLSMGSGRILTLNASSSIESGGVLDLTGASIDLPSGGSLLTDRGLLRIQGGCSLTGSGALAVAPAATVRIQGSTSGSATLTVTNGFTNEGLIELTNTLAGQPATLNVTSGTLTNAVGGQIRVLAGVGTANRTLGAELNNLGTLEVALGAGSTFTLAKSSAHHSNGSLIDLNGGNLTINQSGTAPSFANGGTIDGADGGDVTISGGTFNNTGTLSIASGKTLTLQGSNVFNNLSGATFGGSGTTLSMSGSTMNATPDYSTLESTVVMTSSTWNGPGTFTNASTTVPLALTSSVMNAPFVQTGGATLVCLGGCALAGSFGPNPSGSAIRVQGSTSGGATLTVANGFTNEGLIELTNTLAGQPATLNVTSGTLTNAVGGQIRVLAGVGTANRTLGAELNNLGTLEVALGAGSTFTLAKSSAHHSNGSLIDLNGGNITINQSGTAPSFANGGTIDGADGGDVTISGGTFNNTGTLSIASGRSLTLQGNNVFNNLSGGMIGGSGTTLSLSGSTMNATPDYSTLESTVVMNGSTWNGPGTFTNASTTVPLVLTSSVMNAPFVQTGGATLVCLGGCALAGAFGPNPSGSAIRVQGSTSGSATLTVANGFTNEGLIELTNTLAGQLATLNVTSGTLTNAVGGQIRVLAGAGTANRTLGAELNNLGTLEVALGAGSTFTLAKSSAHHSNGSLIDLNGGNLTINQSGTAPAFTNSGTLTVGTGLSFTISGGAFTNYSSGTLTGGTYNLQGVFKFPGADIVTNAATVLLDGTAAQIVDQTNTDALRNFATNTATGSLTIRNGRNLTRSASVTNAGRFVIGTASTLALTGVDRDYVQTSGITRLEDGNLTATRKVDIQAGVMVGTGTVTGGLRNGGMVSPGVSELPSVATGVLNVTGSYEQIGAGRLRIEFRGTGPGEFDALLVSGNATLDGFLQVHAIDDFLLSVQDTLGVLESAGRTGTFANFISTCPGPGSCVGLLYSPTGASIFGYQVAPADVADGPGHVENPEAPGPDPGVDAQDDAIWPLRLTTGSDGAGQCFLRLELPEPAQVAVDLFDAGGRCVTSMPPAAFGRGRHVLQREIAEQMHGGIRSGVYFARALVRTAGGERRLSTRFIVVR